jgi:hypothetical protein
MKIMDIDEVVYDVCRDWYGSKTTPLMYAVAYRATGEDKKRDIDLPALRAEIDGCLKGCANPENGKGLSRAREILDRKIEQDEVLSKLVELVIRAKASGVEKDDFGVMFAIAWEDA